MTNDLIRRWLEHTEKPDGFAYQYKLNKLVYYEICDDPVVAIEREKQLKNWHRSWKINLISKFNPSWNDLSQIIDDELRYGD